VLLCALVAACTNACTKTRTVAEAAAESPEVFSQVGPFELVERSGGKITREDLLGRPWVASFLFTRCTGPCPRVAGTLRELQSRLGKTSARIVTFSVDPEWDTPKVLREYAAGLGAEPGRWLFLTGDEKAIHELSRTSFKSGAERAPPGTAPIGEQVSHTTRLIAVDKKGRIRGFYAGESGEDLDLLVRRLEFLEKEPD
jgi:cytochrome oxidase Cu insertion factor (SCO1/SenC/PrrC family)